LTRPQIQAISFWFSNLFQNGGKERKKMVLDTPVGERRRVMAAPTVEDKENIAPLPQSSAGLAVMMTPASKMAQSGRGMVTPSNMAKTASITTPCHDSNGRMPQNVEEWSKMILEMPTTTPSEITRIKKVYERALGSGEGCEELDVSAHKDNEMVKLMRDSIHLADKPCSQAKSSSTTKKARRLFLTGLFVVESVTKHLPFP
jgi:hypothetical protein